MLTHALIGDVGAHGRVDTLKLLPPRLTLQLGCLTALSDALSHENGCEMLLSLFARLDGLLLECVGIGLHGLHFLGLGRIPEEVAYEVSERVHVFVRFFLPNNINKKQNMSSDVEAATTTDTSPDKDCKYMVSENYARFETLLVYAPLVATVGSACGITVARGVMALGIIHASECALVAVVLLVLLLLPLRRTPCRRYGGRWQWAAAVAIFALWTALLESIHAPDTSFRFSQTTLAIAVGTPLSLLSGLAMHSLFGIERTERVYRAVSVILAFMIPTLVVAHATLPALPVCFWIAFTLQSALAIGVPANTQWVYYAMTPNDAGTCAILMLVRALLLPLARRQYAFYDPK